MCYTKDGEEQRLFGLFFSKFFYDSVMHTEYIQPYMLLPPDTTVAYLYAMGANVAMKSFPYKNAPEMVSYEALQPGSPTLTKLSNNADVVLYCNLLNYNEVSKGGQAAQIAGDIALAVCLGLVGAYSSPKISEDNLVSMKMMLFSTKSGEKLWDRTSSYTIGMSDPMDTRLRFSNMIYADFKKYCPLTKQFELNETKKKSKK
jgi:hypothetical protein